MIDKFNILKNKLVDVSDLKSNATVDQADFAMAEDRLTDFINKFEYSPVGAKKFEKELDELLCREAKGFSEKQTKLYLRTAKKCLMTLGDDVLVCIQRYAETIYFEDFIFDVRGKKGNKILSSDDLISINAFNTNILKYLIADQIYHPMARPSEHDLVHNERYLNYDHNKVEFQRWAKIKGFNKRDIILSSLAYALHDMVKGTLPRKGQKIEASPSWLKGSTKSVFEKLFAEMSFLSPLSHHKALMEIGVERIFMEIALGPAQTFEAFRGKTEKDKDHVYFKVDGLLSIMNIDAGSILRFDDPGIDIWTIRGKNIFYNVDEIIIHPQLGDEPVFEVKSSVHGVSHRFEGTVFGFASSEPSVGKAETFYGNHARLSFDGIDLNLGHDILSTEKEHRVLLGHEQGMDITLVEKGSGTIREVHNVNEVMWNNRESNYPESAIFISHSHKTALPVPVSELASITTKGNGRPGALDFVIKYDLKVEQGISLAKITKGVKDMPNEDSNIPSPELSHTI